MYHNSTIESVRKKLRAKSKPGPNGCIVWTGALDHRGYGQLRAFKRQRWQAHRLSWLVHFGEIPAGMSVLHRCDNRPCINPDHLFLGTHNDNMADRWEKGRVPVGEQLHKALTGPSVTEIRRRLGAGESLGRLAKEFNVTKSAIWAIKKRIVWKHI